MLEAHDFRYGPLPRANHVFIPLENAMLRPIIRVSLYNRANLTDQMKRHQEDNAHTSFSSTDGNA